MESPEWERTERERERCRDIKMVGGYVAVLTDLFLEHAPITVLAFASMLHQL